MGPHRAAIVVVVVVALAVVGLAHADPPAAAPPAAKAKGPQPYRSQIMLVDALDAVGIFVMTPLAIREDRRPCDNCSGNELWTLVVVGVAGYVAAGPVGHTEAGHHGRAVASGVLRIGLPLVAGLGADAVGFDHDRTLMIAGGGIAAAMMIDWWALADATYDPEPPVAALYLAPVPGGGVVAGYAARWR